VTDVFERLEAFYDAVPRDGSRVETFGTLVLFVREGKGWPFYARPRLGAASAPTTADVAAVRARQRELGIPESFEWVHETTSRLRDTARSCGLEVLDAPLMILDREVIPPATTHGVRIIDPDSSTFAVDIAAARAVAQIGFGAPGTTAGDAGPVERDAAMNALSELEVAEARRMTRSGRRVTALCEDPVAGALASGMVQRVDDVAELVGIATLPQARRRGFGGAVTAGLVATVRRAGADLIFLSAGSDEIARVYERVGFQRIGTACIADAGVSATQ